MGATFKIVRTAVTDEAYTTRAQGRVPNVSLGQKHKDQTWK